MKKLLLHFGMIWATVVVAVVLFVVGALGWYVWQLHPWVPNGQVFALGHWRKGVNP